MRNYFTHSGRVSRRDHRVRLHLEALEDRTLLSNTYLVNLSGDAGNSSTTPSGYTASGDIRFCIEQADANADSTIQFSNSLIGKTITLTQGELQITDSMTINGLGANRLAISGNNASRVFDIDPGTTVTISGLTITNGLAGESAPVFKGFGGGILNQGDLTLKYDVVSHNLADGQGIGTITGPGGPTSPLPLAAAVSPTSAC